MGGIERRAIHGFGGLTYFIPVDCGKARPDPESGINFVGLNLLQCLNIVAFMTSSALCH